MGEFGWRAHACAGHERLVRTNAWALDLGRDPLAENFRFPVRNEVCPAKHVIERGKRAHDGRRA